MPNLHTQSDQATPTTAKIFMNGRSQAVRLPKSFAFAPNTPLILQKENDVLTITPVANLGQVPALFTKLGEHLPDEFVREEFVADKRGW